VCVYSHCLFTVHCNLMLFILSGRNIRYMIYICRVMAVWNVMLCSLEDTHRCFRGSCCFRLWNRRVPLKQLCLLVILNGVTSKKMILFIFIAVRTLNLTTTNQSFSGRQFHHSCFDSEKQHTEIVLYYL